MAEAEFEDEEELAQWMPICDDCDNPVGYYCTTCGDKLCTGCKDHHLSSRRNRDHQVVPYSAGIKAAHDSKSTCPKHRGQKYQMHCKTCRIPVCTPCVIQSHSGHAFSSIPDALSVAREKAIFNLGELTKNIRPRVKDECEKTKKFEADALQKIDAVEYKLRDRARLLHEMVDDTFQENMKQLTTMKENITKPWLQTREKESNDKLRRVERTIKEYEDNLRSDDPIRLISFMNERESENLQSVFPAQVMEMIPLPTFLAASLSREIIQSQLGSVTLTKFQRRETELGTDRIKREEDCDKIFCHRAKLFTFDKDTNQWKEKGIGEMKILKNRDSGKYRLLLRREQVMKLACNHWLTPDLNFQKLKTSEKSWCWVAQDFSENEPKQEQFAVKFKTVDLTDEFKARIDECQADTTETVQQRVTEGGFTFGTPATTQQSTGSTPGGFSFTPASTKPSSGTTPASTTLAGTGTGTTATPSGSADSKPPQQQSLSEMFKPKTGSWSCSCCLIQNSGDVLKCPACYTLKPGVKPEDVPDTKPASTFPMGGGGGIKIGGSTGGASTGGFTFGSGSGTGGFKFGSASATNTTTANTSTTGSTPAGGFKFGSAATTGTTTPTPPNAGSSPAGGFKFTTSTTPSTSGGATPAIQPVSAPTFTFKSTLPSTTSVTATKTTTTTSGFAFGTSTTAASSSPFGGFSFGKPEKPAVKAEADSTKEQNEEEPPSQLAELLQAEVETWICTKCRTPRSVNKCPACGVLKPGVKPEGGEKPKLGLGTFSFTPSSGGFNFGAVSQKSVTESKASEDISKEKPKAQPALTVGESKKTEEKTGFQFSLEPKAVTPSKPGEKKEGPSGFQFTFTPSSSVKSPKSPEVDKDGMYVNKEGEDDHIYFEPIVQLPEKVSLVTGEENEQSPKKDSEKPGATSGGSQLSQSTPIFGSGSQPSTSRGLFGEGSTTTSTGGGLFGLATASGGGDSATSSVFGASSGPMFGTSTSDGFSFVSLAAKSSTSPSGFHKDDSKPFHWYGAGQQLFGASAEGDDSHHDGDEVIQGEDPHFEPVIELPDLLETKTGEEDCDKIFCHRAKLFRFDKDTNQWKEKGIGEMKILKNRESGKYRLLLRREQVLKLACNHWLTPDLNFQKLQISETSWRWVAQDFSDNEPKLEQFAVKFKTVDLANEFKAMVDVCQADTAQTVPQRVAEEEKGSDQALSTEAGRSQASSEKTPVQVTEEDDHDDDEDDFDNEDVEETIFEKRVTFFAREDWKVVGLGILRVVYDDDVNGNKVQVETDTKEIVCNHFIARESAISVVKKKRYCEWSPVDFSTDEPVRRHFRAQFSSESAVEEFEKFFKQGRLLAVDSDISESDIMVVPRETCTDRQPIKINL